MNTISKKSKLLNLKGCIDFLFKKSRISTKHESEREEMSEYVSKTIKAINNGKIKAKYEKDTVGYYFQQLPEPYRSEAFENIFSPLLNHEVRNAADAICFFSWNLTPQGRGHWIELHKSLTNVENKYGLEGEQ